MTDQPNPEATPPPEPRKRTAKKTAAAAPTPEKDETSYAVDQALRLHALWEAKRLLAFDGNDLDGTHATVGELCTLADYILGRPIGPEQATDPRVDLAWHDDGTPGLTFSGAPSPDTSTTQSNTDSNGGTNA